MDKKYLTCLITSLLLLASSSVFAESPAAEDEASQPPMAVDSAPPVAEDDMRPAAEAETAPMETSSQSETQTSGDVLDMSGAGDQTEAMAEPVKQLDFPRRGMSQDKVQNELGRPLEIIPAVGEPPITRWVYDDRVVYFEFSSVVHVVAK